MPFRYLAPLRVVGPLSLLLCVLPTSQILALDPCRINVLDASNGWPVPLVELRTNHGVRFVSDNAGVIAFDLPELMDTETWFDIKGHGYGVPADAFGYNGVRLTPHPGETLTIKVHRELPAKRLGRITGGGIFGESQKLGFELDWREQGLLGCDSVQNAVHGGKLFWGWGDTTLPHYPLGLFHMSGATSELQPLESLEPPVRLRYDYFTDESGTPRNVAEMPGSGPTWLGGYASLPDEGGQQRLVACYVKIKPPLEVYESGLCVWNDEKAVFEKTATLWSKTEESPEAPPAPMGHSLFWEDESGQEWVLFGDPFPTLKCPATFAAWSNPETWQQLQPQETVPSRSGEEQVKPHRGSIAWNDFRQKWVAIFTQAGGQSSLLGEIWYAESKSPTGPWQDAIKVVTHADYTFYNPKLHPEFTDANSPIVLFEGTYTKAFSGASEATPRHDYNQVLYRLDLDDPKLRPTAQR